MAAEGGGSGGYYYSSSKKTDDICEDVCGPQATKAALSMSRLRCALRGFDLKALVVLFVGVPIFIFFVYLHGQKITYFLRPLWESPPKPFNQIPHYYHENVTMENLCRLHGWGVRETPRRVFDAVLFSNELDILAIRWKELHPYVSEFILLESNSTFTGIKKPLFFANNRDQFKFAEVPADLRHRGRAVRQRGEPLRRGVLPTCRTGPAYQDRRYHGR
ncbi:uncharacterized protein M6B38_378390 [Iris pallida]|uniref:Uncharacterized protein n=1 Tax=Iris pallida TaxID=29817 RepID=A0AAX6G8S5_IRIPA|nr:uncharacterized protein M6B38_378390 [Iris pallida]